jgi:23S rRNA (uracil1939-C5)-methyltransferase
MEQENIRKNLIVEKMVNTGLGLSKDQGVPIFIEEVVTGDVVDAKIVYKNKSYEKAVVETINKPSEHRVEPFCAMANVCGGCQWQYINYDYQLEAKREIVKDCLQKIAGVDIKVLPTMPAINTKGYRCKVQYPVSQTKVSKRYLAGYYKKGTHEIVNIKHCPIQPPIIDHVVKFLRDKAQELGIIAYDETKHKGTIRHFIFRYSKSEKNMVLTLVVNDRKIHKHIKDLSEAVFKEFTQVIGVVVNFNTDKTNKIIGEESQLAFGQDYIIERFDKIKFKISAGSFFQVNIESAKNILEVVKELVQKNCNSPKILDAYSGVGTFGIYLSSLAQKVVAIEEYTQAVWDARENLKLNFIENVTMVEGNVKDIFKKLEDAGEKFDLVIIDPPRKGCDAEALDSISNLSEKHIIYVSCSPATLARDMKSLQEKGFEPKFVQPIDMFCHTYHVETVVLFEKNKP